MAERAANREVGLIVPVLTAFDADGGLDWAAMAEEVEYLVEVVRPTMIALAAVEVSEYQYLTEAERGELIRRLARYVDGRVPVLVGISHPAPRVARTWADLAASVGASGVQLLLPRRASGGNPSLRELVDYVRQVAAGLSLPLFLYHNPGPGTEVGPEALAELARIEGVRGIKESSRNLRHIGLALRLLPDHVAYFTTMEVMTASLVLGAKGVTMPPPAALVGRRLADAVGRGDWEEAHRLQAVFAEFPARWMHHGLTAVMKAAMAVVGVPIGDPYPPYARLSAPEREALAAYLADHPAFRP
ncbi:MAG: dihydrodipicolinate synthase family protein [Actinomycetia bacterium]|nr:dihydrodipicolinate synthase family protein [Actinomycetes bacterium]